MRTSLHFVIKGDKRSRKYGVKARKRPKTAVLLIAQKSDQASVWGALGYGERVSLLCTILVVVGFSARFSYKGWWVGK